MEYLLSNSQRQAELSSVATCTELEITILGNKSEEEMQIDSMVYEAYIKKMSYQTVEF